MGTHTIQTLVDLKNKGTLNEYNAKIKILIADKSKEAFAELLAGLSNQNIAAYTPVAEDIVEAIRVDLKNTNNPRMLRFLLNIDNEMNKPTASKITYESLFRKSATNNNDISGMIWLFQAMTPFKKNLDIEQNDFYITLYNDLRKDKTNRLQKELSKKFPSFMDEYHKYISSEQGEKNINKKITSDQIQRTRSEHDEFGHSIHMFGAMAANSAYKRNVYNTLEQAINNIGEDELEKIQKSSPNITDQATLVKILAAKKCTSKMFNNTLYQGMFGTLLICGALTVAIGPFAAIPMTFGIIISAVYARNNRKELQGKINDIIENDKDFDVFVMSIINKKLGETNSPKTLLNSVKNKISGYNSNTNIVLQTLGVMTEAVSANIISPILDTLKNIAHIYDANTIFNYWLNNPKVALEEANTINVEDGSLLSWSRNNKFANLTGFSLLQRNKLNTYLLNNSAEVSEYLKTEIQQQIKQNSSMSKFNKLESFMKSTLSFLGIWEKDQLNLIIDALYSPNHNAHQKLETLRKYCKFQEINDMLTQHLKDNRTQLFPEIAKNVPITIGDLTDEQYKKLYASHLKTQVVIKSQDLVKRTGDAVTLTAAIIISAVALISPISPLTPIIFASILVAGYAITRVAATIRSRQMKKVINTKISDADIDKLIIDYDTLSKNSLSNNIKKSLDSKVVNNITTAFDNNKTRMRSSTKTKVSPIPEIIEVNKVGKKPPPTTRTH